MRGTGRLCWFGPFLASRISERVYVNRTGAVEVASVETTPAHEMAWLSEAVAFANARRTKGGV
jgi:hypothetical protein